MRLTIIGTGKMAEAIIAGAIAKYEIRVIGRSRAKLDALLASYPQIKDGRLLESDCNIDGETVVVCVKPYALKSISTSLKGKADALLSVLAGTTLADLKSSLDATYYVRAMPNLAASFQKSMTTLCGDEIFKEKAIMICESFGDALWVGSEKEIDIATAVAGSGPAFLALIAEALADGAVKEGLKREDAMVLVRGLFEGFAPLIQHKHPAILKDEVMSPGGTTAAGYSALEECGVRDGLIKAISKAYERARG